MILKLESTWMWMWMVSFRLGRKNPGEPLNGGWFICGLKCWRRENLLQQPEIENEIQMGHVPATYCGLTVICPPPPQFHHKSFSDFVVM